MPDDEERIVRLPVTAAPPAAGQRAKAGEDFTFYDTLVQGPPRTRQSDAVTADRSTPAPAGPAKPETGKTRSASRDSTRDGLEVHGEERDREDGRCERGAQDRPRRKDGEGIVVAQGLVARARDDDGVACEGRRDRHAGEARAPTTRSASAAGGAAPAPAKRSPTAGAAPASASAERSDRDRVQEHAGAGRAHATPT